MEDKLVITFSGVTCSGKSRLQFLIKEFLKHEGFEVELEPSDDYYPESYFNEVMSNNLNVALENIKGKRKILLREKTVNRLPYSLINEGLNNKN